MAAERAYRDIMEDKEKPPRENLVINKKKADGTYSMSESERNELKRKRKANVRWYLRFAACLQKSGLSIGQHFQDNGPAQWMSKYSLGNL